jgi:perosamine synthetase
LSSDPIERIPVAGPSITQKEIDYVTDAVTNAWYGNSNIYHERFEKAFADYVGRKYAIALPSCTSALHLSLLSLDLSAGDEVIVPDITWIASSAPINYVNARPVFADVDTKSWCLDAKSFEDNITARTRAVIVVDLYGNMPDMDAILEIAERREIAVIEDAAEAIGSEYKGKKAGSFGLTSTFSFHGSKTLTTGEGGMLVTDDAETYKRCLFLRDHGRQPGDRMFWNREIAYKYKMSSMQAALGLAQLERIQELVERKRQLFGWYRDALAEHVGVENHLYTLNYEAPDVKNTYWMVTAILNPELGITKEQLMSGLERDGIDCRPFFHPLSSIPAYRELPQAQLAQARNTVAYELSPYGVNLPSGLTITKELVDTVCRKVNETLLPAGKCALAVDLT